MSGRLAACCVLAFCGSLQLAAASTPDEIEARRLEYRLAQLEKRLGDLQVAQVVARQQVLDAGPELSRKTCERLAAQMGDPQTFKYLRSEVKELGAKKTLKYFDDGQKDRLAAARSRLETLEEDSSMNCRALAPINP